MAPRFNLAAKRARDLLARAGVKSAPVPVEQIARGLGLLVRHEPLEADVAGMLVRSEVGGAIAVNSEHATTRKRFTIAHELGHYVLHEDEAMHVDRKLRISFRDARSAQAVDEREIEANQFAAELLMPEEWLLDDIDDAVTEWDREDDVWVRKLAKKYAVSEQAMTIRLAKFGYR